MSQSNKLSIIIITRNEETDLAGCLESVQTIADEIILVDSGSTDRTVEIAKKYTEKIFFKDWNGFSSQKQFALDRATSPWVLNIDADERLSPDLAKEIVLTLCRPDLDQWNGFEIPYWHFFCGARLKFGSGQKEKHIRLFRRSAANYGHASVHEGIQVLPRVGLLTNPVYHYSYRDIHDYLGKCNHYTTLIAKQKYSQGDRFKLWHHLRLPWEFFVRFVVKLGFLDGNRGLIYALLSSYYVWLKFVKLKDIEADAL